MVSKAHKRLLDRKAKIEAQLKAHEDRQTKREERANKQKEIKRLQDQIKKLRGKK